MKTLLVSLIGFALMSLVLRLMDVSLFDTFGFEKAAVIVMGYYLVGWFTY